MALGSNKLVFGIIAAATFVIILLAGRRRSKILKFHLKALHSADPVQKGKTLKIFNLVNITQWCVILLVIIGLVSPDSAKWKQTSIIFIVGLHLFPLAFTFGFQEFYFTGAEMVMLAVLYLFLTIAGPTRPIGSLGAGLILSSCAIYMLAVSASAIPE